MKKIAKYFLAALAMTSAVSCAKELTEEFKPANKVQGKSYVFSAYMDDADTKTVIDGNTMQNLWMGDENGNEYITIMEPGSVNTYVCSQGNFEPTAEATFSMAENGGNGLTGKSVFAVYPAGAWSCFNTADSLGVTVTYPNLQYSYAGSYDPQGAVAVAYNPDVEADQHLAFKNTTALLKFQIQATSDPVFNVTVYSLAGEPIAGTMILKQKGEKGSVTAGEDAKSWVEISDKDLMPLDAETDYYIAVAPALLKGGIGVQLNKDEVQTFTISKELNIERNKIYDLGMFSYDAPADDVWYLIGDFNAGNANSIAKTQLEVVGNHYVAKNVTIADGQAFKFYSPTTGKAFYAETGKTQAGAVIPVATDTWNVLTAGNNYSYVAAGTYDIYADKDFAGVAVMKAGAQVPAYPVPSGQFVWNYDDEVEYGGPAYDKVFDLGYTNEGTIYVAKNYDQVVVNPETGETSDWADWRMFGLWEIEETYDGYEVVPTNATSGEIKFKAQVRSWGGVETKYFLLKYSNYTGKAIDIYSPSQWEDEEGMPIPVLDETGAPALDDEGFECYWNGTGLCEFDEDFNKYPVHMELSAEKLPLAETPTDLPVPSGQFVWFDEDYGCQKVFDLGATSEGDIFVALNYDEMCFDPETGEVGSWADPRIVGNWLIEETYSNYEIIPMSPSAGEIRVACTVNDREFGPMTKYVLFQYSNYNGKTIDIFSPATPKDDFGELIPVLDENYEPVLDADGKQCYYSGTGLCVIGDDYITPYPVSMEPSTEKISLIESPTTPAGAQWIIEDPAVAEYFLGASTRTLVNLGATDFSALGGPSFAGDFIHLAYSLEDAYGADAAGMWQAIPTNFLTYTTPYEITMGEDGISGVITIEAYDFMGDPMNIEIPIMYADGMCMFDFSALGLEGQFIAYMASPFVEIQP